MKIKFHKYWNKNNTTMRDYSIYVSDESGSDILGYVVGNELNCQLVPTSQMAIYEQPRTFSESEAYAYRKYLNSLGMEFNNERIQLPV